MYFPAWTFYYPLIFLLHLCVWVCVVITTYPYKNVFKEKRFSLSHCSSGSSSSRSDRYIVLGAPGLWIETGRACGTADSLKWDRKWVKDITKIRSQIPQPLSEAFCIHPKIHMLGLVSRVVLLGGTSRSKNFMEDLLPFVLRCTELPKVPGS